MLLAEFPDAFRWASRSLHPVNIPRRPPSYANACQCHNLWFSASIDTIPPTSSKSHRLFFDDIWNLKFYDPNRVIDPWQSSNHLQMDNLPLEGDTFAPRAARRMRWFIYMMACVWWGFFRKSCLLVLLLLSQSCSLAWMGSPRQSSYPYLSIMCMIMKLVLHGSLLEFNGA